MTTLSVAQHPLLLPVFPAVKLGTFPEHTHLLQQSVLAQTLGGGFNVNSCLLFVFQAYSSSCGGIPSTISDP